MNMIYVIYIHIYIYTVSYTYIYILYIYILYIMHCTQYVSRFTTTSTASFGTELLLQDLAERPAAGLQLHRQLRQA